MIFAPQALDGEVPDSPSDVQAALVQALGRAFSWADAIESGEVHSITDLARTLDVDNSYVVRILKLTTLAPDIIEAILHGVVYIQTGLESGRVQTPTRSRSAVRIDLRRPFRSASKNITLPEGP